MVVVIVGTCKVVPMMVIVTVVAVIKNYRD